MNEGRTTNLEATSADVPAQHVDVGRVVIAGLFALTGLALGVLVHAYSRGIDDLMYPHCGVALNAVLFGVGAAGALVAFASIGLIRQGIARIRHKPVSPTGTIWSAVAAVWIGVVCYYAFVSRHTSHGLFVPSECLL